MLGASLLSLLQGDFDNTVYDDLLLFVSAGSGSSAQPTIFGRTGDTFKIVPNSLPAVINSDTTTGMKFNPAGNLLLMPNSNYTATEIYSRSVNTYTLVGTLPGITSWCSFLAFHPDGTRLFGVTYNSSTTSWPML